VHDTVETTVSITPVADRFFRVMDDVFGYGKQPRDLEQWWTKARPASTRRD
jgi:hypothetical protein